MYRKVWLSFLFIGALAGAETLIGSARADIVGGTDVSDQDPIEKSVVALYSRTQRGGSLCSATLIAKDIALTAAHCVGDGRDEMELIFGSDIRKDRHGAVRVVGVEVPRKWLEKRFSDRDVGDIAVIRFEGKLPRGFKPLRISPARLELEIGESVLLAGYGISDARTRIGAGRLRKTEVKVLDPHFGKTEVLFSQSHGSGACHGDSGGPALVSKGGKVFLFGVTNRGYPDSAPDDCRHQVVYTKASAYRKWISTAIRDLRAAR